MKKIFLFSILICLSLSVFGQRIDTDAAIDNFTTQMAVFPQEKIYIQSDKPYYIAGENMFYKFFQ
ncbi:MAG: hypothetical protein LBE11_00900 [Prevotellaceae bacterium]|jgi:uncharacterized protein YfaS (alpha-2-macroglobulin family)|nr:hypothetical protein [Prevotellaceae bacterium]